MPRIRSIKPGFCTSEAIAALTIPCELHFAKLWTYCDDEGRGADNPRLIKAACWPLRDEIGAEEVEDWQQELADNGRIVRYEVDGKRYFQVLNWSEHQKPQHPKASEIPGPDSENAQEVSPETEKPQEASPTLLHGEGEGVVDVVGEGAGAVSPENDDTERTFENFWELYPRRNGRKNNRKEALAVWKRLSKSKRDLATTAVRIYAQEVDRGEILAKDPDRWLRAEKWEDWLKPAVHSIRKHYGEKFEAPKQEQTEPDPPCEHSDPMCLACRRENIARLKEMASAVGGGE